MPGAARRMEPARTSQRWLGTSASAGSSRNVRTNSCDIFWTATDTPGEANRIQCRSLATGAVLGLTWPSPGPPGPGRVVALELSLIHISEPTRQAEISYAVFCLKKKKLDAIREELVTM